MKIELYPSFEQVFNGEELKGLFYPLCKVTQVGRGITNPLYFVSSNGVWMNESEKTDFNQPSYTLFDIENDKYTFRGSLALYTGFEQARGVFMLLEADFAQQGAQYLAEKWTSGRYIQAIKPTIADWGGLDIDYFMQTFYEYSLNKLYFQNTGNFGAFQQLIEGWAAAEKSPYVYAITEDNSTGFADIEVNKEFLFPKDMDIATFQKIGFTVGSEFFTDGNDCYLLYDEFNRQVICVNHYS